MSYQTLKAFLKSFPTKFDEMVSTLDKLKTEVRVDFKTTETVDDIIYEIQFPGYSKNDVKIEIYSEKVVGLLSMVINVENPRYGKKKFQCYIERDIEVENINSNMEHGILYVVIPRKHTETLLKVINVD